MAQDMLNLRTIMLKEHIKLLVTFLKHPLNYIMWYAVQYPCHVFPWVCRFFGMLSEAGLTWPLK